MTSPQNGDPLLQGADWRSLLPTLRLSHAYGLAVWQAAVERLDDPPPRPKFNDFREGRVGDGVELPGLRLHLLLENRESERHSWELLVDPNATDGGLGPMERWLAHVVPLMPIPFEGTLEFRVQDGEFGSVLHAVEREVVVDRADRQLARVSARELVRTLREQRSITNAQGEQLLAMMDGINETIWASAAHVVAASESYGERRSRPKRRTDWKNDLAEVGVMALAKFVRAPSAPAPEPESPEREEERPQNLRAWLFLLAGHEADYDIQQVLGAAAGQVPREDLEDPNASCRALARACSSLLHASFEGAVEAAHRAIEAALDSLGAELVGYPDDPFDLRTHEPVGGEGTEVAELVCWGVRRGATVLEPAKVVLTAGEGVDGA